MPKGRGFLALTVSFQLGAHLVETPISYVYICRLSRALVSAILGASRDMRDT